MRALTRSAAAALVALSLIGATAPVRAAGVCSPTAETLKALKDHDQLAQAFTGSAGDQSMIVLTSPDGRWTILTEGADASTVCLVGYGADWTAAKPETPPAAVPNNLPDAPALLKNGLRLIRETDNDFIRQ